MANLYKIRVDLRLNARLGHLGRSHGDLDFTSSPTIDVRRRAFRNVKTSRRARGAGGVPFTLRNYSQFIIQCQIIVPWQVLRDELV